MTSQRERDLTCRDLLSAMAIGGAALITGSARSALSATSPTTPPQLPHPAPTGPRIRPDDPKASFLVNKMTGDLKAGIGKRMRLDAQTAIPIVPSPISSDYIEKVLNAWILAGAPNN